MSVKGIFINTKKAQDSIFESGMMVYNCIRLSQSYELDYQEVDINNRTIPSGYDFYFFNYHPGTIPWMDTSGLKQLPGLVITMILEVLPNDPFVMCPDNHFDGYCVLDPTLRSNNRKVYAFPRPLEAVDNLPPYVEKDIPVIGSFGFATKGKGFQHVVEAVNNEFSEAKIKINIPFGEFVPDSETYAAYLADLCSQMAGPGIKVTVTHDYMSKPELIQWCRQNTLNCFLYDRELPGLAATTDQAIVAERPLLVSDNETFRHILTYMKPYPQLSLKESIRTSLPSVLKMKQDWSTESFARQFDHMLSTLMAAFRKRKQIEEYFEIPILKNDMFEKMIRRYRKYKRYLSATKIKYLFARKGQSKNEKYI